MKKIAIIGGGITGLSAAFYLEKARRSGAALSYTVFEQSSRLGGALLTEQVDGFLVEGGADSFLTEKPWAAELCQELGIADQLIASNDAQRQTFVVRKKKLIPLPPGMTFFVPTDEEAIQESELFSTQAKKRILDEAWMPLAEAPSGDVSVADFVIRHFGTEMLERVADPLLAGIYGGDARKLSMQAVMPRFLKMEQHHGSLMRALKKNSAPAGASKPLFTTLRNGMQQLVGTLTAQLPAQTIHASAPVVGVELKGARWNLLSKNQAAQFDAVVMATPAYAAAGLLKATSSHVAGLLEKIPYSSSVTVALGFNKDPGASAQLTGFGFLAPRGEGSRVLACTFVHNKFPNRVPPDRALLRVFFGGVRDEAALRLTDHDLVRLARTELGALLKIKGEPIFARVHRWPRAMPQYNLGHTDLLQRLSKALGELPGLVLGGSAYDGVGISDCVRQGRLAASQVLAAVRVSEGERPSRNASLT